MDKLTAFFEKIDLEKLVPPMGTLLEKLQFVARVAVIVGPIVMLVLGLWYFLLPPKEANHRAGFRTWFGMGSVEAWRTTQKIAGITWGVVGLVLTVVMWLISRGFDSLDMMEMATKAFKCLLWQVGLALVTYVGISITATVLYTSKGEFRFKKKETEEQTAEPVAAAGTKTEEEEAAEAAAQAEQIAAEVEAIAEELEETVVEVE